MRKVLLINPHDTAQTGYTNPPIGLLYLAGTLLEAGVAVEVVDGCREGRAAIEAALARFCPDFVGIVCLTPARQKAFEAARIAKAFDPRIQVVIGGAHATIMPNQILESYPEIDVVVLGEGEQTLVEIVRGDALEGIKGIAYRHEGGIRKTSPRPLVKDLDTIPFPAWHLLDLRRYEARGAGVFRGIDMAQEPRVSVIFSRGCKGHCNFCSTWWIWRGWRRRSPANMVDELEILNKTQGIRHFCFADDALTIDRDATIGLCREIVDRGLRIAFHATTRTDCVDPEMLEWLARAGCYGIAYGIETGSTDVLEGMNKENDTETAARAIAMTKNAGIECTALMIVGNVGETRSSVMDTVRFLKLTEPDVLGTTGSLWVLPGTAVYRDCVKKGVIDDSFWLGDEPYMVYDLEWPRQVLAEFEATIRDYRNIDPGAPKPRVGGPEVSSGSMPASSGLVSRWTRYVHAEVNEFSHTTEWVDAQAQHVELMPLLPASCREVLDLGCGDGWSTDRLRKSGRNAVGVTVNPGEAEHARSVYGLEQVVADMHDLPFPDGRFEGIYCRECYEHSVAPFLALCEMNRVLRPGGYALVNLPWEEWIREESHFSVLTPSQMREMFYKCRFVVESEGRTKEGHYWYLGRKVGEIGQPHPYAPPVPGQAWFPAKEVVKAAGDKPRIICQMRIKNEEAWLRDVLDSMARIADGIVILDDGSTDRTPEICRSHPAVVQYVHQIEATIDEVRDKNRLLKMAMKENPDWILCMDGDEIFEQSAPERILEAIRTCPPDVSVLDIEFLYMWDDMEHYRVDGIYRRIFHHRLFRVVGQDREALSFAPTAHGGNFHCESVPPNIVGRSMEIDVKVLHLGYMPREVRVRKHEWYCRNDPQHATQGFYDHLLDQPGMEIERWVERPFVASPGVPVQAAGDVQAQAKQEFKPEYYYAQARRNVADMVPHSARRVLDVGCGHGMTGGLLRSERGIEVCGIEIHRDVAAVAAMHLDQVAVGDLEMEDIPFPESHFDCIILADVLEHLVDPWKALRKISRHLAPGGTFVASIPNVRNLDVLAKIVEGSFAYAEQGILDRTHLRFFTLRDMYALFESAGFEAKLEEVVRDPLFAGVDLASFPSGEKIEYGRLSIASASREELAELTTIQFLFSARRKAETSPTTLAPVPDASVVVPVFNNWNYTKACLDSLFAAGEASRFEVVVVDDCSTDETSKGLSTYPGPLRVVRHEANRGFATSCNDGARIARGEFVVFLNNDTVVLPGWLDSLLEALRNESDIGAVGNLQIFPDTGMVQQAGIVCGPDRNVRSIYHNELPATHPVVNRQRDLQFVAGSCIALPRDLFESLGGFDEAYLNSCEDIDLCMKVRDAGRRVVYVPKSRIFHYESKTVSGHPKDSPNYRRFLERWGDRLIHDERTILEQDGFMEPASEVRPTVGNSSPRTSRIAFDIRTLSIPGSVVRGIGHYTLHHLESVVAARPGADITLLVHDVDPLPAPIASRIEALGLRVRRWSDAQAEDFDLVHVTDPMNVEIGHLSPFPRYGSTRVSSTFYDVTPLRIYRERMASFGGYLARLDSFVRRCANLMCISEFTRSDLIAATGVQESRTSVIGAGFNASSSGRIWSESEGAKLLRRLGIHGQYVLHVGAVDPHKNPETLLSVSQTLHRARSVQLVVAGKLSGAILSMREQVTELGWQGIIFTNFLEREELEFLYSRAVATLFPSRYEGFGFPALEAMANGCPVVCSDVTSLPEVVGDAAFTHDPDDALSAVRCVLRLMDEPALRETMVAKGLERAKSFTWECVADRTWAQWEALVSQQPSAVHAPDPLAMIRWLSPIWDPSGYADESRAFLKHLEHAGLNPSLFSVGRHSEAFRTSYPARDRAELEGMMEREYRADLPIVLDVPGHGLQKIPGAGHHVGRTTFETDGLPADWLPRCNLMDEIWVPCAFNAETFRKAGVKVPILVVPEGVDSDRFRPGLDPLPLPGPNRATTFLSVFEWTHRKGPDLLLEAWAHTFGPEDDVRLVLRTYPPNHIEGDPSAWVDDKIRQELARIGKRREQCAPIVVLGAQIPDAEMPRLYASADVYLAPSRGEGWGRPHLEAMSCGVPVIATRWSGNLEFQDDDNSWLIAVDGLERIDEREEFAAYRGQKWASPSVADMGRLMSLAARDASVRRAKSERARADVVARWDWRRVGAIAETRLREILYGVPAERSALAGGYAEITRAVELPREASAPQEIRWVGPLFNYSGYARFGREAVGAIEAGGMRACLDPLVNDPRWFEGMRGRPAAVERWKSLLTREGRGGTLVVCEVPCSADGRSDLLAQVRDAYRDVQRKVAWTMFETDRLPSGWTETLGRMDQVWVPSRHNMETFAAAGIDSSKLRLVPCGIDAAPFDAVRGRPFPLPGPRAATTFLSVFQWSRRKGWDVLLEAWARAFGPHDDVRLILRCHPLGGASDVASQMDAWLVAHGIERRSMAPIVVLEEFVPEDRMPSLYEAADVFVLPSRGEGWGLPYLEAMAAGKPCIGSAWGASGDFLHEGVGWMLPVHGTVPVDTQACAENPFLAPDHRWADVRVVDLVEALRQAAASPEERRVRGAKARDEVRSRWTPEATASAIRSALSEPVGETFHAPAVQRLLPALRGRIPIAMPAYNRHAYLREVLGGLRGCRDLDRFCIVTGEEPGCPQTRALFDAVDWMPIVRNIHSERLGCNANVLGTIDRALELGDRFVSLEDDIVPGVDFLSFVRWGLDRFRDDPAIFDVSGYQRHVDPPPRSEAGKVLAFDWFCPWGWASWRDRWERFRREVQVPESGSASWDVFVCKWVVESARLKELRPAVGRVQNIGEEGTWVPSAAWHRDNHRTPHWIGSLGWTPVPRQSFHLEGEEAGIAPESLAVGTVGSSRLSGALAGVAAGLRAAHGARASAVVPDWIADDAMIEPPRGDAPDRHLSIRWEGSQFVHHSLAHVNRELCIGLAKSGQDLSIIPYEPDQFAPGGDPDLGILAQLTNAPLEGPCQVHVRHQWPPNLEAPAEGRWVVIQPWEFGSPPKHWMPSFRDLVDELWVPSHYCRDLYVRAGCDPDRVQVVPNGVDTDRFCPGLEPLASLPTKKGLRFLFVGGTIARKGFDRLMEAWEQAFGPDDPVELLIKDMGGKTSYVGQTAEGKVRALQQSGRCAPIHYLNDDLHPDDLPRLYASGDVLVHPYRGEGFGLPIAEAMACGLPVIITKGGAADDFCGDEEGWMIPAERKLLPGGKVDQWETVEPAWLLDPDVEALVAALRDAAGHPELRAARGVNARRRIAEHFTWKHATVRALERLRAIVERPVRRKISVVAPAQGASLPSEDLSLLLVEIESAVGRQDFPEAERLSLEAVGDHSHEPLAWLMRAMVLRGQGKAGKALEALNKALSNGGGPEVRFEMMALHLQGGKIAPARVQWNILRDKHATWVEQRRSYHQEQGLPWLPDRLKSEAPKSSKRGKSPAPPLRRR